MTKSNQKDFQHSTKCWICYMHHCHITGKYQGSMHKKCYPNLNLFTKIPVLFLNLQNFDSHVVDQELREYISKINVIPKTLEKYMCITMEQSKKDAINPGLTLAFIDDIHFLNDSSENLAKTLRKKAFIF